MWLVFKDEGVSLHTLMYGEASTGRTQLQEQSPWWLQFRSGPQVTHGFAHLGYAYLGISACFVSLWARPQKLSSGTMKSLFAAFGFF